MDVSDRCTCKHIEWFFFQAEENQYGKSGVFECLPCPEGCESCEDDRPCVVSLDWVMRTTILVLSCIVICCLPIVVVFTWKYGNVKVGWSHLVIVLLEG